jgi:hypothetical protein
MNDLINESDVMNVEWDGSVPHMVRVDSLAPTLDELDITDLLWFSTRLQTQVEELESA